MCGIVGCLYKQSIGPVGEVQVKMLDALFRRGPDSAGTALYGMPRAADFVLHARFAENGDGYSERAAESLRQLAGVRAVSHAGSDLRAEVEWDGSLEQLADSVEHLSRPRRQSRHGLLGGIASDALDGKLEVVSIGHALEIIKDLGSASDLDRVYGLSSLEGTHAIGHTRMATESRVDVLHSHPFWARPFADIAVVHNGHITNEHKLKRRLGMKGRRFFTGNDSEVIAVYIADRLADGATLDQALKDSVQELDGSFAYLVSTPDGIGVARDQFATKPLVWAENDEVVVLASEEVAIRAAFPAADLLPQELAAGEVRWWLR